MSKGPKINYTKRNFTTRDNLGITAPINSFQAELCPVINTVTPRAFYWIFTVWNYYDYWENYNPDHRNTIDFRNNYLKKNDYYFVMANLLTPDSDRDSLAGKDNCAIDYRNNPDGPYAYNRNYFAFQYGGMQYYVPGCSTLGFITDTDDQGNEFAFPKITEKAGVPLARAFEEVIKDTEYYKNYRLNNTPVPKFVLEELGRKMSLDLKGMDECKNLLRQAFFEPKRNILLDNSNLILSKDYLLFINQRISHKDINSPKMRNILFDLCSPGGVYEKELPEELKEISVAWELVVGRQYIALSIELIWKFMLMTLTTPMDLTSWVNACFNQATWTINIDDPIKTIKQNAYYDFDTREEMLLRGARSSKDISLNLENALKVLLSICNIFEDRIDIKPELLAMGEDISIAKVIERVAEFQGKPSSELLAFIMTEWALKRHEMVAFRKMQNDRDGFYIEKIDDKYYQKYISYPDFTGNRMMQLKHVMVDLDMLE